VIDIEKITNDLKADEGFKDRVYTCSAGKQTIGYGWNLEANDLPEPIAARMLDYGVCRAIQECEGFDWFYQLNGARKGVIINMIFNMGKSRLLGFKKMIAALKEQDFDRAADEMMDSNWYNQVGFRAVRLVKEMREG